MNDAPDSIRVNRADANGSPHDIPEDRSDAEDSIRSIREDRPGARPHQGAEEHSPFWLAFKFALACLLVAAIAKGIGYSNPTTGIISAAFLVANGPMETLRTAAVRMGALAIGAVVGVAGAYWGQTSGNVVPLLYFPILGVVTGLLAAKSQPLLYITVIGVVVATTGAQADEGIWATATEVAVQVAISCAVGPLVVWGAEKAHAWWRGRTT